MSVDIGEAIRTGLARTATLPGAFFAGAIVVLGLGMTVLMNSLIGGLLTETPELREVFEESPDMTYEEFLATVEGSFPLDFLEVDPTVLVAGILGIWLVQMVVRIGVIRWFVQAGAEGLHAGLFTRRLLWTIANLIFGFILFAAVTVGIPLVLIFGVATVGGTPLALLAILVLIIPVLYLNVALYFYNYDIVVNGSNAIDGLTNSWELTSGNRLLLFVLGAVVVISASVIGAIVGAATGSSTLLSTVSTQIVNGVIGVASIGIAAVAFNQLRGEDVVGRGEAVDAVGADEL